MTDQGASGPREPTPSLEELARRAASGDGAALDALVAGIANDVHRIALRMLWHPEDAEDATQEILFKVITAVATFRGESSFRTWALRIATNHLLNVRRSRIEEQGLTFESFGADLLDGLSDTRAAEPDQALLVEEVKVGCTQAMLLCLDRDHRIAYILGDVFELQSDLAAEILSVEPAAFRKRLSRARSRLRDFMRSYCGLLEPTAPCSCEARVAPAIELGRVDPAALLFAGKGTPSARRLPVLEAVAEMERIHEMAAIHRSHPDFEAPGRVREAIRSVLRSRPLRLSE